MALDRWSSMALDRWRSMALVGACRFIVGARRAFVALYSVFFEPCGVLSRLVASSLRLPVASSSRFVGACAGMRETRLRLLVLAGFTRNNVYEEPFGCIQKEVSQSWLGVSGLESPGQIGPELAPELDF